MARTGEKVSGQGATYHEIFPRTVATWQEGGGAVGLGQGDLNFGMVTLEGGRGDRQTAAREGGSRRHRTYAFSSPTAEERSPT